ncbi:DUF1297 domain-containing protein [Candidatus Microgenomates bacterium]|nr:DUF1297 domain-containing protein [Candidatus Microgenomates bacterium]
MTSVKDYKNPIIAVFARHSALEVCFGAKKMGFKTLVIAEKGRGKVYDQYFKRGPSADSTRASTELSRMSSPQASSGRPSVGCVDEIFYVEKIKDLLTADVQKKLRAKNCIFIPHRSFEVYLGDYDGIEKKFKIPVFGNRFLFRAEERSVKPNQYDLLEKGGIKYPKIFKNPKDIDRMVIVKVSVNEKERSFERAFFLANSYKEFLTESEKLIKIGKITESGLKNVIIEEFLLGAQVNFNFFYSPTLGRLELLGTDTRRQTNLDGLLRLPQTQQAQILAKIRPTYEEAGHIAVTVLESFLEMAYEMGERFVEATKEMFGPGIIGPFGLQAVILPGPPKKEIAVFDVALRMPGSPGIAATPYSSYLYGRPVSMGERVAMEIKEAIKTNQLPKIIT